MVPVTYSALTEGPNPVSSVSTASSSAGISQTAPSVNPAQQTLLPVAPAPSTAGNPLGSVDPSQTIQVSLSLQGRDASELQQLIIEQNTPGSAYYDQFLTPTAYQSDFGPNYALVASLASYLGSYGLTTSQTGDLMLVHGTVGEVEKAFSTTLLEYRDGTGTAWAPSSEPRIPAALAPVVASVLGFNTFEKAEPLQLFPLNLATPSEMSPHGLIGVSVTSPLSITQSGTVTMTPMTGLSASFTASVTLPTNGTCTPCTFTWDFGDGSAVQIYNVSTTTDGASHTYLEAVNQFSNGMQLIVNVTDPQGDAGQIAATVYPTLSPQWMESAYGEKTLLSQGYSGQGMNIGLDELCDPSFGNGGTSIYTSSVDTFANASGLPLLNVVYSGPGTTCSSSSGEEEWSLETLLDMDWSHAMAPNATLHVYFGTGLTDIGGGDATWANASAGVFLGSNSWGLSEGYWNYVQGQPLPFDSTWSQAASQGISLFSATGDCGAVDNTSNAPSTGFNVSYPASNPNGVAVGGTVVQTDHSGNWVNEYTWNSSAYSGSGYCTNSWGTGGGWSKMFSQPAYQLGMSGTGWAPPKYWPASNPRGLPDVSMDAATYVDIYYPGDATISYPAGWIPTGGTSLASPMLAATMAVVLQSMNRNYNTIAPGFLNVPIYKIGKSASEYASSLHDVTLGNNADPVGYNAAVGWDPCTGWGTPNATGLVNGLIYAMPPRYAISGDVLDYSTGSGIVGATVSAGVGQASTTTTAGGAYTLYLTNGTYTFTATATGYNPNTLALIVNGSALSGENIVLSSLSLGVANTISGALLTETGIALEGGLVVATGGPTSGSSSYYTTSGGDFQLYLLSGTYSITGSYQPPPPATSPPLNSTTVSLTVTGPLYGYVITLHYSRFSLTGLILSTTTHLPISKADVYGYGIISTAGTTNAQGKFFLHMPSGPVSLDIVAAGYLSTSVSTSIAVLDTSAVTIYMVPSKAIVNQVIVSIRVLGARNSKGVPEVKGMSSTTLDVWANNSTTGAFQGGIGLALSNTLGGSFSMVNVLTTSTGMDSVTFTAPWSSIDITDVLVAAVFTAGWTGNYATSVLILSDVNGCGTQCVYPISGTVLSSLGPAIKGASVTLMTSLGATVATTTTTSGGRFSFSEGNGSYTVEATAQGFKGTASMGLSIAGNAVTLAPLVLAAPSPSPSTGASFINAYTVVPPVLLGIVLALTVYFLVWRLRRKEKKEDETLTTSSSTPAEPIDAQVEKLPAAPAPAPVGPLPSSPQAPSETMSLPPPPPPPPSP